MATTGLRVLGAAFCITVSTWASAAGNAPPAALRLIEPGQWELRARPADGGAVRRICVTDRWQLMQIEHGQASCGRFVVADQPNRVAATYDCAQAGSGRTDLRVENPRLVQIRSQGISRGAPFELALEGRRVAACP